MSDATNSMTIQELSGPQRSLVLVRAAMPKQGAEWATKQRVETTVYPGNVQGSQQVLGPAELPSDWSGEWNTTRLLRYGGPTFQGVTLTTAWDVYQAFDSMFYSGRQMKVTWAPTSNRTIVRVGRITEFKVQFDRDDDLHWSATFDWSDRNIQQAKVGPQTPQPTNSSDQLQQSVTDLLTKLALMGQVLSHYPQPGTQQVANTGFSISALQNLLSLPRQVVQQWATAAQNVEARIGQIAALVQSVQSEPKDSKDQLADIASGFNATTADFVATVTQQDLSAYSSSQLPVDLVNISRFYAECLTAADEVADQCIAAEKALREPQSATLPNGTANANVPQSPTILAQYRTRSGDTFASIAVTYYGTADLGAALARYNGYPSYQVFTPNGALLIIPSQSTLSIPQIAITYPLSA